MESNLLQNTLLRTCPRQGFSHQATAATTQSNSSNVVANRGINSMDEAKSSTCGIYGIMYVTIARSSTHNAPSTLQTKPTERQPHIASHTTNDDSASIPASWIRRRNTCIYSLERVHTSDTYTNTHTCRERQTHGNT